MLADDALPVSAAPRAPRLHQSLGRFDVALFFIITGSNLQWVATAAAAGPSSLAVWIIGGLAMFVPIAIVVVYLSSRFPDEGGMYIWSKRAFGPFAGFLTGWTYWMSNVPYFPALLYFTAGNALFIGAADRGPLATSPAYFAVVSLAGLALGTVVNIFGLDVAKWLNNIGALSRWAVTLLLIGLSAVAFAKFGARTAIDAATLRPGLALKDIIFWSVIAFAWTGPESLSFMAGEVKNPRRSIPAGLAIAAPVTAIVYVLGTISVLVILRPADVNASAGVMQAIGGAATRLGWPALTPVAAVLVVISCLGSVGAWLGAVARIPFVAGIDYYLPAKFGRMHPRWNAPIAALVTQAIVAAGFIVLGQGGTTVKGAYDVLVSTTVIATMIPFWLLFLSAIKLTFDAGGAPSIRLPGGATTVIVTASIGLLTTAVSTVLAVFPADDDPNKVLAVIKILGLTALMVGSGIAVYRIGGRRKAARCAEAGYRNGQMMAIAVVPASVADEARAAAILTEYAEALAIVVRDTPADVRRYLVPPGGMWLAQDGPDLVGCVALRPLDAGNGEMKRLYVRPNYRGRGVADALLDALEAGARARGFAQLYLDTHHGLRAATRFYERRGYTHCERYNDNAQATIFLRRAL